MDALRFGSSEWPFAPGEGPFHVKGVSYRGHQKFIDEHIPGGYAGIVEQLEPPLRKFYGQPFLASCWYDLAPLVAVAPYCAAACGLGIEQYVFRRAQLQVDQDVSGVYAYLIKLASARMLATRLPRLITQYFDFTSVDTREVSDTRVLTRHSGLPRPFAPWLVTVATGYLERVLQVAGASTLTISAGALLHEGHSHGIETVSVDVEVVFG
jgi:hypothetical protein